MPENNLDNEHDPIPMRNKLHIAMISFLTVALVASGYLAHELLWTNYVAHIRAESVRVQILKSWSEPDQSLVKNRNNRSSSNNANNGFALLYIPRLKDYVWALPILEGVGADQLNSGVGHYPLSAGPGDVGNFAIAGHRATHGEPFAYFDQLRSNDQVIVRTNKHWFTYTLDRDRMIKPTETWVVNYPLKPPLNELITSEKLISLVTCDPRWGSARRWVWWGHLTKITRSRPAAIALGSAP